MQYFDRFIVMKYSDELEQLPATYDRAFAQDVGEFAAWLRANQHRSLLAIGAGGSLAIAQMAVALHEKATGHISRSGEPMDIYLATEPFHEAAILQVTAGGSHGDAMAIASRLAPLADGPAILCGVANSELEAELGDHVPIFAYPLLPDVHGWVAVNVLLGQAVVVARAYAEAFPTVFSDVPDSLSALLTHGDSLASNVEYWATELRAVLERPALFCLHGPVTRTLAIDLDSKFTESGLGELNLSEYRNFAHGRYQSLLDRQDEVGVLCFFSDEEALVASEVIASLPDWFPHAAVHVDEREFAANHISQIVHLLVIVGALSVVRGVDVGWGSRDTFGDPLYEKVPQIHHLAN